MLHFGSQVLRYETYQRNNTIKPLTLDDMASDRLKEFASGCCLLKRGKKLTIKEPHQDGKKETAAS